jgi:hypothetical protein
MTKKLGVCGSPPEPRFGLYEGDGICIWMKTEREVDRIPKTDRTCHTGHSGQQLQPFQFAGTGPGEDHGHTGKYLFPILRNEANCLNGRYN